MAILFLCFFVSSCSNSPNPRPLPRMYPRVVFPERNEVVFSKDICNMTFKYPDYFNYVQDTSFFDSRPIHPCWFDMNALSLNASIHFSYYPISDRSAYDKLINDVYKMVGEHNIMATFRSEKPIMNEKENAFGLAFEIEGEVASPLQFFLTDSTRNFVRASLYFNAKVDPDSTKIIYDYIKQDIDLMIRSWEWNETK